MSINIWEKIFNKTILLTKSFKCISINYNGLFSKQCFPLIIIWCYSRFNLWWKILWIKFIIEKKNEQRFDLLFTLIIRLSRFVCVWFFTWIGKLISTIKHLIISKYEIETNDVLLGLSISRLNRIQSWRLALKYAHL